MLIGNLLNGEWINYLRGLNLLSIVFRFFLATACGSLIGFERGRKSHAAGLRTHIVVCIGGAAAIMINQYLSIYINPASDPARMGAQVISGIGFLGAGTIIITGQNRGQQIRGLTTAAGLWASACMGLAIGIGFYEGAVIMCLFLFVVISTLTRIDGQILKRSKKQSLYLEHLDTIPFSDVLKTLRGAGWHVSDMQTLSHATTDRQSMLIDIYCNNVHSYNQNVLQLLDSLDGVLYVDKL